jgi:hypothetical protein
MRANFQEQIFGRSVGAIQRLKVANKKIITNPSLDPG